MNNIKDKVLPFKSNWLTSLFDVLTNYLTQSMVEMSLIYSILPRGVIP